MLTQLRLQGFKSWADTGELRLAPITGFFGANSSGKSSILQALLLLKQTTTSQAGNLALHFGDDTTFVNLGDFTAASHQHDIDSAISFTIGWTPRRGQYERHGIGPIKHIQFNVRLSARPGNDHSAAMVDSMSYSLLGPTMGASVGLTRNPATGSYSFTSDPEGKESPLDGDTGSDNTPIFFYGFPFDVRFSQEYGWLASDCEGQLHRLLADLRYLGPLRARPPRQVTWSGDNTIDIGNAGERTIQALLSAIHSSNRFAPKQQVHSPFELEGKVAGWLKSIGLIDSFRVERLIEARPYYEVKVKRTADSPEVLLADVGLGVSQVLPVLVLCLLAPPRSTIVLEQPELHLHPAVQSSLADILIEAVKERDLQIMVESHSEHLLRRLQRRVAEEEIAGDDVALYFCENAGSKSAINLLEMDDLGNIANWPRDFFGDEFGEMAAMTEAAIKRRATDAAG